MQLRKRPPCGALTEGVSSSGRLIGSVTRELQSGYNQHSYPPSEKLVSSLVRESFAGTQAYPTAATLMTRLDEEMDATTLDNIVCKLDLPVSSP